MDARDINWSVNFEITVNGEEKMFYELTETKQEFIVDHIRNNYYSGTFTTYENY